MAWRSVRRARTSPAFPGPYRGGFPDVERQRGPQAGTPRAPTVRLAWLWVDQGVWITALRGGTTVEALNAELAGSEPWEWVDEQAPTAAGEP